MINALMRGPIFVGAANINVVPSLVRWFLGFETCPRAPGEGQATKQRLRDCSLILRNPNEVHGSWTLYFGILVMVLDTSDVRNRG